MLGFRSLIFSLFVNLLWFHLIVCANRTIFNSIGQPNIVAINGWTTFDEGFVYGNDDYIYWSVNANSNRPGPEYSVCPGNQETVVNSGLERNWLISDYYLSEAQSINIQILCEETTIFPIPDCRNAFTIHTLQSDNPINVSNSLSQFSPIETTHLPQDRYIFANFGLNKNGFYIGFLNHGTCVKLLSSLFYYNICPSLTTAEMSSVPETPVPRPSRQPTRVNISCPPRSLSLNRAECYSDSTWRLYACECEAGWRQLSNLSCAACPVDRYKELVGNERDCVMCPSESGTNGNTGSVMCACDAGFYRGEGDNVNMGCGRSPSAVRNIRVERSSVQIAMLRVRWDEPVEVWNRSVWYNLSLYTRESGGGGVLKWSGISVGLSYDLSESELEVSREYVLVVTSLNNLVELSGVVNSENISFLSTFPVLSNLSLVSNDSVLEFVYELKGGVSELSFELNYTSNGGVMRQVTVNGCPLVSGDAYRCRVSVNNFNVSADFVLALNTFSCIEVGGRLSLNLTLQQSSSTRNPTSSSFTTSTSPDSAPLTLSRSTIFYLILAGSAIALIIVVTAIILFFLACCYLIKKPLKRIYCTFKVDYKYDYSDIPNTILNPQPDYTDPTSFKDLREAVRQFANEVNNADISIIKVIGNGEFGDVCAGTLNQEGQLISVALKTLKPNATEKSRSDFFLEASIMGQFHHENIILLLGVTLKPPIMIITPFMSNLSLDKFLQKREEQLSCTQLGKLALGVSCGMMYLSSRSYVHRDLAARNVLVDRDLTPKIADFGLSRVTEDEFYTMHKRGKVAIRWTALEAILYYRFNAASDVWSFGILVWEIMSFGAMPYEDMDLLNLVEKLQHGYRMPIPNNCPQQLYDLMLACWEEEPERRPSFQQLHFTLKEMIESYFGARRSGKLFRSFQDDPLSYSCVGDWLDSLNMVRYEDDFNENGLTSLNSVWCLNEQDLLRIGIIPINHRNKIMTSIRKANRVLGRTFKESTTTRI